MKLLYVPFPYFEHIEHIACARAIAFRRHLIRLRRSLKPKYYRIICEAMDGMDDGDFFPTLYE